MRLLQFLCLLVFSASPLVAEDIVPIKTVEKDGVIDKLQVAVVTYTKGESNLQIIGTVHVADEVYYRMLNERFKKYDALLYELVAPEGTKPEKDQRTMMRNIANVFLELEHQLAVVDYNASNFVHADFTPEKFQAVMKERGDTMVTIALSAISDLLRQYNKNKETVTDQELQNQSIQVIGNPNASVELKRMMAKQFVDSDKISTGFGATIESYLIDERNKEALRVVDIESKSKNNIGLFYGAAHLPDFDERLTASGWKRDKVEYDTAWDNLSKTQDELEYLLKLLQGIERDKQ